MMRVLVPLVLLLIAGQACAYTMSANDHEWLIYDDNGNVVLSGVTPFVITKIDVDQDYALVCTDTGWCKVYHVPDREIVLRARNIDLQYPYVVKHVGDSSFKLCTLDGLECTIHKEAIKTFIMQLIIDYMKTKDPVLKQAILVLINIYIGFGE